MGCFHPNGEMEGRGRKEKARHIGCQLPTSFTRAPTKNHSHSRHQAKFPNSAFRGCQLHANYRTLVNASTVIPSHCQNPYQPTPPVLCAPCSQPLEKKPVSRFTQLPAFVAIFTHNHKRASDLFLCKR
ncbi:hypothetical protein J3458_001281 [Metarhizium acridum]|uniref:uncharacterized protein n=1 Tax=Metarhizium acridum TaxID=92637 RepID=UPI001C6B6AFC|nr:hypothetical protein J3458_001281 [Metarhizium acridum]